MVRSTIRELLMSRPEGKWFLGDDECVIYEDDVNLRFVLDRDSEDEDMREIAKNFREWAASRYPSPEMYKIRYVLYYGSTPIKGFGMFLVDGPRKVSPVPFFREGEDSFENGGAADLESYVVARAIGSAFGSDVDATMRQGRIDVPTSGDVL